MSFRQMLPFLLLNIIVSAVVVLSILFWWDNHSGEVAVSEATAAATLPHTFVEATIVGLPLPVASSELQALRVAAEAMAKPTAAMAVLDALDRDTGRP